MRRKDGKEHTYWCVVQSVRRDGQVVQKTVAQLGELDARGRACTWALARAIMGREGQSDLFDHQSWAEAAFRIHNSGLSLRPIRHQRSDRVQAHILVCFLACVLWKTLEQ